MTDLTSKLAKEAASEFFDKRGQKIREMGHTIITEVTCPNEKTYNIDAKVFINKNEDPEDPKIQRKVKEIIKNHYTYKSRKYNINLTIRKPLY